MSRTEGVGPMQYGTKGLLGEKFADIEEKYDLSEAKEGFGQEGEDDVDASDDGGDDDTEEEDAHASDDRENTSDDGDDNQASSGSEFFEGEAF